MNWLSTMFERMCSPAAPEQQHKTRDQRQRQWDGAWAAYGGSTPKSESPSLGEESLFGGNISNGAPPPPRLQSSSSSSPTSGSQELIYGRSGRRRRTSSTSARSSSNGGSSFGLSAAQLHAAMARSEATPAPPGTETALATLADPALATIIGWIEARECGDAETAAALCSDDFVFASPDGEGLNGLEEAKSTIFSKVCV